MDRKAWTNSENNCLNIYLIIINLFDYFSDGRLSLDEFGLICRALFRNERGQVYQVKPEQLQQMFAVFDKNCDGFLDKTEFQFCWNHWIKVVRHLI